MSADGQTMMPSSLLRQARNQKQMSLQELATQTRLSVSIHEAMERDDFQALGQLVYARGYYRKAATALGLNPSTLMSCFEAATGTESPIPPVSQRPSIKYREGAGPMAWVASVLLLVGGLGAAGWWLWQSGRLPF